MIDRTKEISRWSAEIDRARARVRAEGSKKIHRTKEIYRDACRCSHRILGSYLALLAWKKRVNCVVIDRDELFAYLGLKAMRTQRLKWLAHDIKDMFPYTQALYRGGHMRAYTYRL